jgi:hypothetical protein
MVAPVATSSEEEEAVTLSTEELARMTSEGTTTPICLSGAEGTTVLEADPVVTPAEEDLEWIWN